MARSLYQEDCIFCKIAAERIPSKKVLSTDKIFAFHDINPVAPTHILIVPKVHIETLNDLTADDAELVGHLFVAAKDIAKSLGLDERGYRTVINCNREGGQTVFHLHVHLIAGKPMGWPPFPLA
ncbi:MAG: histidine triad nucleotide-binding protein [Candidatus Thermochlorobacter sp.]|nr:MAG: histidine triad nucleotide-binding protein [[Chlorobium] sp. 445]